MSTVDASASGFSWWESRRLRYNSALIIAGVGAFVLYAALAWSFPQRLPCAEITAFTIAFQALGYLIAMCVANVLYFSGVIAERLFRPRDLIAFRERTFRTGLWFSVALPFLVPLALVVSVMFGLQTSADCL